MSNYLKIRTITLIIFLLTIICCKQAKDQESKEYLEYKFAKNITVQEDDSLLTINSSGNSIIFDKKDLPVKSVMVETSAAVAFLDQLGKIDLIKGVVDANYIYNPKIEQGIKNNSILNIGSSSELFVEIVLKNKPQLIIASSNPVLAKYHRMLEQNGVKILYLDEYKEQEPLGQVEYLKLYGLIFDKKDDAKTQFEMIEKRYDSIKNIIQSKGRGQVSTLVNTMFGDIWSLPTSESLQAKLIKDAKGNYIFDGLKGGTNSNLTFEEVYSKAKTTNYWINIYGANSLSEMKAQFPHYYWFNAFRKGNVFSYNKRVNPKGANDYFEKGILRPDIVLNDLGKIFYPNLFKGYDLYFYQQLK